MAETEVKILGVDPDQVVSRLEKLGARCTFVGRVKCVHFDQPKRPIRAAHCLFRLRRWEGDSVYPSKFEICFKGPKQIIDGCKVREEIETTVADAERFETMMEHLGYEITMDNEKVRRSYEWEGLHFDLDQYPEVPAYMEIEGPDHTAIERAIEALALRYFPAFEVSTETADELFARLWPNVNFDRLKF